ncbi:MAG: HAMP domain-containing sensor histidine kinase [Candidatus Izemoplasma sp.]|nr:HAMP domain-containing sensor histidine kinase [Candidatus Izemoplasma sp.]
MKFLDRVKQQTKNSIQFFPKVFRKLSISTQLTLTIILLFASFFLLQSILNNQFFKNYYIDSEFDNIQTDLINYIDALNSPDTDPYDIMYNFTQENNAYSVIVDGQYRILKSTFTNYTITIDNVQDEALYTLLVPENNYDYSIGDTIDATIYEYNESLYSAALIETNDMTIYESNIACSNETCITISGTITSIQKPNNLNYLFQENLLVETEINKLRNDAINLNNHAYEYKEGEVAYWYRSNDGPEDALVFVHELDWVRVVTIIPIADTNDIISIVSSYNYYVYATAIAIIFLWSFRLSSIISKPTKKIEAVTREIAQLNFNVEANEYNNREHASLSRSINLITRNLKETLAAINAKNKELTELYEEQSKQVLLKKRLVSSISHELKTPLMIMQVIIQGILDDIIAKKDIDGELENVLDEISKSSLMIQDMLQIYRLDNAETVLEKTHFDISKVTLDFLKEFEHTIKKDQFDLDINIQDQVIVFADEKLIKRVISNFLTNAIKYTPPTERIYIEISEHENYVYYELTNYGININEKELDNIWIPFYRIKQTQNMQKHTKGSGVGLYLVSEILTAHEADYGIRNVNNGVKAWFKLYTKIDGNL